MSTKQILINARIKEAIRVAVVKDQELCNFNLETLNIDHKKANIYLGKVARIEPSLEAAFIDYGEKKQGFLPLKEISPTCFLRPTGMQERIKINQILKVGQELLVQVEKSERSNKGAALTTYISLAGSYLVLMPNNPRSNGISRQIEGEEREIAKDQLAQLDVPDGMGIILRTAGIGRPLTELRRDLDMLKRFWFDYLLLAKTTEKAPRLIHREIDVVTRTLRDSILDDVQTIWVDTKETFLKIQQILTRLYPANHIEIKHYESGVPLFHHFKIESEIKKIYQRQVVLRSGGSIVLDQTEALLAIDVNSSKATDAKNIEETALQTNLEAAKEIARQLRLRDLGGLIVIDFIDMSNPKHQRDVEQTLRESLTLDKARIQFGRISRFGLLEMVRQRLRPSVEEGQNQICSHCLGTGFTRNVESAAVDLIREIEFIATTAHGGCLQIRSDLALSSLLINEKKRYLMDLEEAYQLRIVVLPDHTLQHLTYEVHHIRSFEARQLGTSYEQLSDKNHKISDYQSSWGQHREKPAVDGMFEDIASTITQKADQTSELVHQKAAGFSQRLQQFLKSAKHSLQKIIKHQEIPEKTQQTVAAAQDEAKKVEKNIRPRSGHESRRRSGTNTNYKMANNRPDKASVSAADKPSVAPKEAPTETRAPKTKSAPNRQRSTEKKYQQANKGDISAQKIVGPIKPIKIKKPLALARLQPRTKCDDRRKNQILADLNRNAIGGDQRVWLLEQLYHEGKRPSRSDDPSSLPEENSSSYPKRSIMHCRRRLPHQVSLSD